MADQPAKTPQAPQPEAVEPNCPRCKKSEFASTSKTFVGMEGLFVYCSSCGAVVGWVPKPEKTSKVGSR
jgi:hypothetical protein